MLDERREVVHTEKDVGVAELRSRLDVRTLDVSRRRGPEIRIDVLVVLAAIELNDVDRRLSELAGVIHRFRPSLGLGAML